VQICVTGGNVQMIVGGGQTAVCWPPGPPGGPSGQSGATVGHCGTHEIKCVGAGAAFAGC
jgi:hypothetical protein